MATYILLLTLTPEGRERMLDDTDSLRRAEAGIQRPGIDVLGLYGVLGEWDFVSIIEAPDNDSAASFALELGVRAGVHTTTLPAIPIARLEGASREAAARAGAGIGQPSGSPPSRGSPRGPEPTTGSIV